MDVFLIRTLQLIVCFSLLVLLHEAGHFFFAKLFKVRVEKFCLFFDPWFRLFKFKPKNSDTTYAVGWLPLGGYVKIAGMIDESMDTEQMKQPEQPWEFRAKPAWQRLLIMIGGVLVNFVLALFIYSMVLYTWGDTYVPLQSMTHGMKFNETARQLGFRDGDILCRTDRGELQRFDSNEAIGQVYRDLSQAQWVTVLRHGKEVRIALPGDLSMLSMMKEEPPFVTVLQPALVDSVLPSSPAYKGGLRAGDYLVAFNGKPISTWNEYNDLQGRMSDVLASASPQDSARMRRVTVVYRHPGAATPDTARITLGADFRMGVTHGSILRGYKTYTREYGFLESFPAGARHGCAVLAGYVNDLKYLFTKDGAQSIGSFGTIGSLFPVYWDWQRFWELTAFISIILAFMNILPIPALDGGHVFFLLYEIIARRKPSEKFMERAQVTGMCLLMGLMLWAIMNDVIRFLF